MVPTSFFRILSPSSHCLKKPLVLPTSTESGLRTIRFVPEQILDNHSLRLKPDRASPRFAKKKSAKPIEYLSFILSIDLICGDSARYRNWRGINFWFMRF